MSRLFYKKAFTLIELLVVVAIISLLSSVVIVSLQDSREKAAIAKLKEQTRQIQTALELYRSDHGEYPPVISSNVVTLAETYLSNYIETPTLDTSQIKSINFYAHGQNFSGTGVLYYFVYVTGTPSESEKISCEGHGDTPYVIYFTSYDETRHDFPYMLYDNGGGDGYLVNDISYCLNTPI